MKLKIITSIIFYSLLSLQLIAQNPYFPLEKGKIWTYEYEGMFRTPDGQKSQIKILDETKSIGGKEYLIMQTSMGSGDSYDVVQTTYVRFGENGEILSLDENEGKEALVFPSSPMTLGKTWQAKQAGVQVKSEIIGTSEELKTSNTTYSNCLVIESKRENTSIKSYLKKGIGMVGISILMNGEEKIMQYLVE